MIDLTRARSLTEGRQIAIVGAGLVGSGWAYVFARAGLEVKVFDRDSRASASVVPYLTQEVSESDGASQAAQEALTRRVSVVSSLEEAVRGAVYIQESVLERVEIKRALLTELEPLVDDDVVIGSSTSGIGTSKFNSDSQLAARLLVAHPVNPPHLLPVVELVPSPDTDEHAVDFAAALLASVGQSVVRLRREIEGFVLNRLQAALLREAWALVEDGIASCEDIDKTVRDGLGRRWAFMGPFETIDLNAPAGVSDYARRFGELYRSIAASRQHDKGWSTDLVDSVERQRREHLPLDGLRGKQAWRDRMLLRLTRALQVEASPREGQA